MVPNKTFGVEIFVIFDDCIINRSNPGTFTGLLYRKLARIMHGISIFIALTSQEVLRRPSEWTIRFISLCI